MITRWPCLAPAACTGKITTYGWSISRREILQNVWGHLGEHVAIVERPSETAPVRPGAPNVISTIRGYGQGLG